MNKTVEDFGEQWTTYRDNEGYYGSVELLSDIVGPYCPDLKGKKIADIGAGTGRISIMLVSSGAKEVVAIEPSMAFKVLKDNTKEYPVTCVNDTGEGVIKYAPYDMVVSIGVIHHIPEPDIVISNAYTSLVKGGHIVVWLYGYEGNQLYLIVFNTLRAITIKLPDAILKLLCHFLNGILSLYILLCRFLPLPMRSYINGVLSKFDRKKRYLVIFDQLNPAYAKYYKKNEAINLIEKAGFKNVKAFHRHGYSWTVVGEK